MSMAPTKNAPTKKAGTKIPENEEASKIQMASTIWARHH
jgi:hypothetical protein